MNRSLHITINESGAATGRRARRRRRFGFDPEGNPTMALPDDPEGNPTMALPDDPEGNPTMALPDDPEGNPTMALPDDPEGNPTMALPDDPEGNPTMAYPDDPRWWDHRSARASAGADHEDDDSGCCRCCRADAQNNGAARATSPQAPYSGFVIVRLRSGLVSSAALDLFALAAEKSLPALAAALTLELPATTTVSSTLAPTPTDRKLVSRPLIDRPVRRIEVAGKVCLVPSRADVIEALRDFEASAALGPLAPLHSLTAYWRVDLRPFPAEAAAVVARLNGLAEVDLAYRELAAVDPGLQGFADDQGYLADAPIGIGAAWARRLLNDGSLKVKVCDLEQGWQPQHVEFTDALLAPEPIYGANRALEGSPDYRGHHGTAVLGQLAATGRSLEGAATLPGDFFLASHYKSLEDKEIQKDGDGNDILVPHPFAGTNGHVAAAIAGVLASALGGRTPFADGDVLLLEVQRGLWPTEIDAADFDAIRLASAKGLAVVEAAGNGAFNLDAFVEAETGRTLRRGTAAFRDSGAIVVGAARAALPHDRASFSNFGSRVDCYGWGETVTTCGYGDLQNGIANDDTLAYTNSFSGTSSAAPIVAGAAILVQALSLKTTNAALKPLALRTVLADRRTGTPQGPNVAGAIGVMPNLRTLLGGVLGLVPEPYLRQALSDDGGRGGSRPRGSSPDILLSTLPTTLKPSDVVEYYGEGDRADLAAPGLSVMYPLNAQEPPPRLYIRVRNRGLEGRSNRQVQLFASPAATLIMPNFWAPAGQVSLGEVDQGDLLKVFEVPTWSDHLPTAQFDDPLIPLSFLAVVRLVPEITETFKHDQLLGLPPGGAYFDWQRYLAFLRARHVAWRNVHKVVASNAFNLDFVIGGATDHTRHFDFEVIQRLPAQVEVKFQAREGLAAKWRQRRTWPSESETLPQAPRLLVRHLALPAGAREPVSFKVTQNAKIGVGHSLALRQLWRGHEVGRITWVFADSPGE